ncbi:PAS domain-containing sensor histidine kinase [Clostridium sp.]|uniref:PAS domain-containing sensor histidine kinase n=1 Tax=Clostridium sp. TaxID=1506 RepID=UPI003D6CF5D9
MSEHDIKVLQEIDIDKIIELSKSLLFENDRNAFYRELINIVDSYFKAKKILVIEAVDKNFEVVVEWKEQCSEVIFYNENSIRETSNIFRFSIEQICACREEKIINNDSDEFEIFHPLIFNEELLGILYIEKKSHYSQMELKMLKLICLQVAAVMDRMYMEDIKVQKIKCELRESEEGYKRLFELSPDAICVHCDGKIVLANPTAERLFDIKDPKGIIGRDVMDFVHPDYVNLAKRRIKTIIEGGMVTSFIEEKFLSNDGIIIDVEVGTSGFKYKGKSAVLVVVRNINQRKKMERNLKENESLLREITENISDMIAKADVDGTIKFITPAKNDILGYGIGNVIGKNLLDFVYIDDKKAVLKKIKKLIRTTMNQKIQFRGIHVDGRIIWADVSFNTLLDDNNKVVGLILSARDITKRIEAEQVIKENKEKEIFLNQAIEYDKFRTDFFANISHELRTPINVILGTIQLMNLKFEELFKENDEKSKKHLRTMKQNCYRLVRLIDNLIDVTKIDAGYFEIHLSNCNIVSVIEEITLSVAEYVENKGISLIFDTEIEEKIIACDKDKIERIMLNLISNAIKFTKLGGDLLVNIFERSDSIVVSVRDTGIGIPKEKQTCIFDRFIQVDKSLTRNREGSGIGLSLVKALVEMHGGKIFLESQVNVGSEFSFELPIRQLPESEDEYVNNNFNADSNIEKIHIEFSDIYF